MAAEGHNGEWAHDEDAPNQMLACGAHFKIQPNTEDGEVDHTAINQVQIKYCDVNNWDEQAAGESMG